MKRRYGAVAIVAAVLVLGPGYRAVAHRQGTQSSAVQQHEELPQAGMGQDAAHAQGRMPRMDDTMQEMTRTMERADLLARTLDDMMKSKWGQSDEEMRTIQEISQSISDISEQLKVDMDRYNQMLGYEDLMSDSVIQRQMEGFRTHIKGVAAQMGQALGNLESITKEIQRRRAGK